MKFLTFVMVISVLIQEAFGTEYYWSLDARFPKKYPSAQASCEAWLNWVDTNSPYKDTDGEDFLFSHFSLHQIAAHHGPGPRFICRVEIYMIYKKGTQAGKIFLATWQNAFTHRLGNTCSLGKVYNPITGAECGHDTQKGAPPKLSSFTQPGLPQICIGNSINFVVGNNYQNEIDFKFGGYSSLGFSRSYNSLDGLWRHSHSTRLRFSGEDNVALVMSDGRESFFTFKRGIVTPVSADIGVLTKTTVGWSYLAADNQKFDFDNAGLLARWANAYGAVQKYSYIDDQVIVTDGLGNSLSFTMNKEHQPLFLNAPGMQVAYGYSIDKRLISITRTTDDLISQRRFHYEDSRNSALLTGVTDERGLRYATWRYDDQGRPISSEHINGADRVAVAYHNDGTVLVTNELGKSTKYAFKTIKGVKHITSMLGEPSMNCPGSNSSFTYNSNGLLKERVDNKGVITSYFYNVRGLVASYTKAVGTPQERTVAVEWHPKLFLPVTIVEPDRTRDYFYDDKGFLIKKTYLER